MTALCRVRVVHQTTVLGMIHTEPDCDQECQDRNVTVLSNPDGPCVETTMIRTLEDTDCEAFVALRRKALLDSPLAFAASPSDDRAASVESVREQLRGSSDQVIIGAFRPALIGVVGLYRERHIKASHKMHIWGMYVAPQHRCQGIASQLLKAAVDHARRLSDVSWVHLSVSSAAPVAKRLYERAGFEAWGKEPAALRHDGQTVDEHHMALRLE